MFGMSSERTCPDCKLSLKRIELVDHQGGSSPHVGLAYVFDEKPRLSAFRGELTNRAGVVHGYLCPQCQRVLLYATPTVSP